jgi:DNA-directed RNA polymerase specialized sigma24 family protein
MQKQSQYNAESPTRLDQIDTQWSLLRLAHQQSFAQAGPARNALALRYSNAIRGYVGAMVKDAQDADELAQEVLVRLIRGDFAAANPERGRFRDLLKVALRNMVRTFWNKKQRRAGTALDVAEVSTADAYADDPEWDAAWQQSLLTLAWTALADYERSQSGSIANTLLRLRAEHPDDDIADLSNRLTEKTGRSFTPATVRQQLRRARLRFAELLIEEIAKGIENPSPERIEEELVETGLMPYVRDFLPADWRTRGELREGSES